MGPKNPASQELHATKYRQPDETFDDYCVRYARTVSDGEKHFRHLLGGLREQRILPGGRQQLAVGNPYATTAFSCFVGGRIPDSLTGIMSELHDSMMTLRTGGGCGWDFGTIRPENEPVRGLGPGAFASGPVSFMGMWNAGCQTIRSSGMRRGAMMGVLPCWHPDVMKFVRAKRKKGVLENFNVSVGITDPFMEAVDADGLFELKFDGRSYGSVRALDVWAVIMESNWDWAEPGVLFLDRINKMNPLAYCETIYATNPCAEQPLPPHGACLLGSLNLVRYIVPSYARHVRGGDGAAVLNRRRGYEIDMDLLRADAAACVRAFDNVIDVTTYPLEEQRQEALAKRRMGLGLCGVANALEVCGLPYGSTEYVEAQNRVLEALRDTAYHTSCDLSREKGSFPLFDADKWLSSGYGKTLPDEIRDRIRRDGLRNGLLLSLAPTGTIALTADNVSSGIEPVQAYELFRKINTERGQVEVELKDFAYDHYGVKGRLAHEVSPHQHVEVLCAAQKYIDSSCSKTINVRGRRPDGEQEEGEITFDEFKDVYRLAYLGGAKGCTTYNQNGKRGSIFRHKPKKAETVAAVLSVSPDAETVFDVIPAPTPDEGAACFFEPGQGRTCGD